MQISFNCVAALDSIAIYPLSSSIVSNICHRHWNKYELKLTFGTRPNCATASDILWSYPCIIHCILFSRTKFDELTVIFSIVEDDFRRRPTSAMLYRRLLRGCTNISFFLLCLMFVNLFLWEIGREIRTISVFAFILAAHIIVGPCHWVSSVVNWCGFWISCSTNLLW